MNTHYADISIVTPLVFRKSDIKTIMRCPLKLLEWLKLKRFSVPNFDETGQLKFLYVLVVESKVKRNSAVWKFLIKLNIYLCYDPRISLLGIYQEKENTSG